MDAGIGARELHQALTSFQAGKTEAAKTSAVVALEAFTAGGDRTGAAAAHQLLGILAVSESRFEDALAHIDAALPIREGTGDLEGVAALLQERFELSLRCGDLQGARLAMEQQIKTHARSGDREGRAHAMHQLAQLHIQEGNDAAAETLLQEAYFALEGPGTERARSALQLLFSNLYLARRDPRRALMHAQQGLELASQAKFKPAEVDAQQQLGVVLSVSGNFVGARRVLEDALVGRELMRDVEGKFQVLRELSGVEIALGEVESGLGRLEAAARSSREVKNQVGEITALQLLQLAADEQGRPEVALRAALELVAAARVLGDREALAAALFSLGTRYAAQEDLAGARKVFGEALAIQEAAGHGHGAAVSAGMLGQVVAASGDLEEGLGLMRRSVAELEALGGEESLAAAEAIREIIVELSA